MVCSNPKHTIHGNRTIQPSVPLKCFPTGGCSLCQGWTTETPGWCFGIVFPCPIVDLVCILCRGCCCKKSDSLGITACTFVPFCTMCLPILVRSTRSFQDQLALPHNLPAGSTCGSGSTRDAQAFFFQLSGSAGCSGRKSLEATPRMVRCHFWTNFRTTTSSRIAVILLSHVEPKQLIC